MKNPFEDKKKTTVRRDAKDVYPTKGLNKPQLTPTTPLDILFADLETKLEGKLHEISLNVLERRIKNKETDSETATYDVIAYLLESLLKIQEFSLQSSLDSTLIKISLHDIKTFSKLVSLIIIHGIYPIIINYGIGIPFQKRNLNDFASDRQIKIVPLPKNPEFHEKVLRLIYDQLFSIFKTESDVKNLMLRGTGFSDFLTVTIALMTVPPFSKENIAFNEVVTFPDTYELFQNYSLLLSSPSPAYFKLFVMDKLTKLPYSSPRNDGLLTLIEFLLGLRENEEINVEKFEHVANVVLTKPRDINTVEYFTSIGTQSYDLLVNINKPTVTSCVGFIVEKLWEKNRLVTQDFILKKIWSVFNPEVREGIIVSEAHLNNGINVLISLTKKGLTPSLMRALMEPILLPIWSYYNFLKDKHKSAEVVDGILVGYFTVLKDSDEKENVYGLDIIAKNLLYQGGDDWEFEIGPNDLVQISKKLIFHEDKSQRVQKFVSSLDVACENFVTLLKELDTEFVQKLFINILNRWINQNTLEENPFLSLMDVRLLESLGNTFKDSLARSPFDMLEIVDNFISLKGNPSPVKVEDADSDDEDDYDEDFVRQTLPVVLELLSAVLSESSVELDDSCFELLKSIKEKLKLVATNSISQAAAKSLHDRIDLLISGENPASSERDAQTKVLTRAVTSLNDPLVPIRAHGLYLLRQLVDAKSEVLTIDFVINLHLVQLKDPEPFIYLNVIKGLESLLELDEEEVLKILTTIYSDGETELDEKLRIGEVLLRYIQRRNAAFSGQNARLVVETTLSNIRRPSDETDKKDNRLRMSSMSLLGVCCKVNPLGLLDNIENAIDCAIGILQLENDKDSAIMRRAAVVLLHDLVIGTSSTQDVPFPNSYKQKVLDILKYHVDTDSDLLVREQCQTVLSDIDELTRLAFEIE